MKTIFVKVYSIYPYCLSLFLHCNSKSLPSVEFHCALKNLPKSCGPEMPPLQHFPYIFISTGIPL